jgi:hypothetical protein
MNSSVEMVIGTPLYLPPSGSFILLSGGQYACLCKRFSHVERLSALVVIFQEYSVQVAVNDGRLTRWLQRLGRIRGNWFGQKRRRKANEMLRDKVVSMITLQLRGNHIPVRFVQRR